MTLIFYLIINHIWIFLDISENVRVMLFKREYSGRESVCHCCARSLSHFLEHTWYSSSRAANALRKSAQAAAHVHAMSAKLYF